MSTVLGERPKGKMPTDVEDSMSRIEDLIDGQGPVWHNLVGMRLSAIAQKYGKEWANFIIVDMGLDTMGWSPKE
jgi:hypothetical protein